MFKKLVEKITEEVKIPPSRFLEYSRSKPNSSTSDDNFFSIGDDDTNTSLDSNNYGFSSVQLVSPTQERPRKNSTSSFASDVSFLPKYEPGSMYHLQSDLDVSASEVEDNISTASSQLGHLSKEQIYSAYQKSQKQYHKYRGRYTDLSRHYKELEREIVKMKSILVETQDKAIRRVTELKEQCSLEQKAKAHLEAALRDEIDERNYKIKTLQTQISLLQTENGTNNLVNVEDSSNHSSDNLENLTKYLNDSRKEIENLNAKIQELKANSIVFQSKEHEYKSKISALEKELADMSEREKENNLNIALVKRELHNEILLKDTEIGNVKKDYEILKQKLESADLEGKSTGNQKMENLQSQNIKLIERVENLTQKCTNLETELIKMQTYKMEVDNYKKKALELEDQIKHYQDINNELEKTNSQHVETLRQEKEMYENRITQIRDDAKKGILSLDKKIREKLEAEFSQREETIRDEFTAKLQDLSSSSNTTQELQLQLLDKDSFIAKISEQLDNTNTELIKKMEAYSDLEKSHLQLIEECNSLQSMISNLEKDKNSVDIYKEKLVRLEDHIKTLQEELKDLNQYKEKAQYEFENAKQHLKLIKDKECIIDNLELKLKTLEEDKVQLDLEKKELVKSLSDQTANINQLQLKLEEETNRGIELDKNVSNLLNQIELLKNVNRDLEIKQNSFGSDKNEAESTIKELEMQLKSFIESSEKQEKIILDELFSFKNELNILDEYKNKSFEESGIKDKVAILRDIFIEKNNDFKNLIEKQSLLEQDNQSHIIQIESLRSDIQILEEKYNNMESEFSDTKRQLQDKEIEIKKLYDVSKELNIKIFNLERNLALEEDKCSKFSQENDRLEKSIKELKEKYKMFEESEYKDIKNKVLELEKLNETLQKQCNENIEENRKTIQKLEEDCCKTNELYNQEKFKVENLSKELEKLEETLKNIKDNKHIELQEFIAANEKLRKEKSELELEITKLSNEILNLSNTIKKQKTDFDQLLTKTNEFDKLIENLKMEKEEAIKEEQEQQKALQKQVKVLSQKLEKNVKDSSTIANLQAQLSKYKDIEKTLEEETHIKLQLEEALNIKDEEIYILRKQNKEFFKEIGILKNEIQLLTHEVYHKGDTNAKLEQCEIERDALKVERTKIQDELLEANKRIQQIFIDNQNINEENQTLSQEKEELKLALELLKEKQNNGPDLEKLKLDNLELNNTIDELNKKLTDLENENSKLKTEKKSSATNELNIGKIQQDFYEIKEKCDDLFIENKNLKLEYGTLEEKCNNFSKIKEKLETQIKESEEHYNELLKEKQLLTDEINELKTAPINYNKNNSRLDNLQTLKKEQNLLSETEKQQYDKEIDILRDKLIKYKSLDLTNKSSIEFYENELQKIKNQNEKLTRKLDETLVTLNHCTDLSNSTEIEYLKNILYKYMLGQESVVLARVIAAVCKFDPQQTELILQKEQQKQTLLGQLGLI